MNGVGVTGYLEDMDRKSGAGLQVTGWWDDYRQLKYYRHIRNQIAHENNATEEGLCSEDDSAWIEAFHHRILDRTDPLALYCAARRKQQSPPPRRKVESSFQQKTAEPHQEKHRGRAVLLIVAFAAVTLLLFCLHRWL